MTAQVIAKKTPFSEGFYPAGERAVDDAKVDVRSLKYRADVDGLRAIAVLLVLVFHGGLSLFPAGFVGVDIFFVISGYLTTAIILKAIDSGTFSFAEFYSRRIWRLQPAMLALFIATLALAAFFYLPEDFTDFLKSEKYASLLISNQYFERSTTGYAAGDTSNLLLMHTWSLAIEWQWYLVLPLFLWLLRRYCSQFLFKAVVLSLTIGLAALSMYLSSKYPSKSYYFFTARIFELLIGSCAVMFNSDRLKLSPAWTSLLGIASVLAIFYCATRENILLGFPDYHALIVCLATAVLLSRTGSAGSVTAKALSFRPLVLIGTISYSLYLWHWPVLATTSYLGFKQSTELTVVYFVTTFVLAALSYVLIERKFRKPKLGLPMTVGLMMVLPAIALSAAYSQSVAKDGWPERFGSGVTEMFGMLKSAEVPNRGECLDGASDGSDPRCIMGAPHPEAQALLIGDSFSNQYWNFVDVMAKDANISVMAQAYSACLALPNVYLYDWWQSKDTIYQDCHDNVADYYELIKKNHYKYVILGQIWESYTGGSIVTKLEDERTVELSHQRFEAAIRDALNIIKESGATPVFIKATIPMPAGVNECLSRRITFREKMGSLETSQACETVAWDVTENEWLSSVFRQLKAEYPNLILIDPKDVQCASGQCMTTVDGAPVYRDIGHVTDYASLKFGETYLNRYGNPLKPAK
ncbi:acyltransferase family protein (plasmid) [Pseudomonas silesiensis]|uniref:acyltransferase family protein n=1 Tax=Pseudomonas silesiensis TaxID=1853130 RepID=UPI0030D19843